MKKHKLSLILGVVTLLVGTFVIVVCTAARKPESTIPQRPPLEPVKVDTTFAFINYDTNHLFIGSDSSLMRAFFKKWKAVTTECKGNLTIMHIGGSHVQAGTFPHQVRRNLLSYYPDMVASRGMIFPYSAAKKCNNPYDYRTIRSHALALTRNVYKEPEQKLGLCGIAVTARDSMATIDIVLNEPLFDFDTRQIILFGESPEGVVPQIECGRNTLVPSRIDSIQRRYLFNLASAADSFRIVMPCDSGQSFTLTGVYLRNKKPGITYHSIGVNGAAVPDYLRCPYFVQDLKLVKPDLVIFGIGINDAAGPNFSPETFHDNYIALCDSIRKVNPNCAFIFVTNNDSFKKHRRAYNVNMNGPKVRDVCYRLAEETHGAVWDQFTIMGGLKSMDKWRLAKLAQSDRVHFTRKGYEMVGNLLTNAILESYLHFTDSSTPVSQDTVSQSHQGVMLSLPSPSNPNTKQQSNRHANDERHIYISY